MLIIVGVQGEWLLDPQREDGTVTNLPVLALLLATATVGFALLLLSVMGLRAQAGWSTRPARIGALTTVAGAGSLVVFGLVALVTSLLTGRLQEASFLAFVLGMLLLSIGLVTWGLSLRRRRFARGGWQVLLLAGVAAFGALAIEPDPWHDLSLTVVFVSWSVLGVLLLRQGERPASEPTPDRTASRVADHARPSDG